MSTGYFASGARLFVDGKELHGVTNISSNIGCAMEELDRAKHNNVILGITPKCSTVEFEMKMKQPFCGRPADVWRMRAFWEGFNGGFTLPRGKMFRSARSHSQSSIK